MERSVIETSRGKIQYRISGSEKPNLVLLNGGSGPIEGWMKILPDLSGAASVFSYNRLGVAGSDKPKEPQDGITIVETLREALQIVQFEPPYLLAGHSLGGLYANLYARRYPDEVSGIVFIESSHPKDLLLEAYQGKAVKTINRLLAMFDSLFPHKQFDEVHYLKETVQQIHASDRFPDIPVYVITGGKPNKMIPEEVRKKRMEHQLELLSLSTRSKHISAENSGHFPQFSEPRIVIDTIKACLEHIKQG